MSVLRVWRVRQQGIGCNERKLVPGKIVLRRVQKKVKTLTQAYSLKVARQVHNVSLRRCPGKSEAQFDRDDNCCWHSQLQPPVPHIKVNSGVACATSIRTKILPCRWVGHARKTRARRIWTSLRSIVNGKLGTQNLAPNRRKTKDNVERKTGKKDAETRNGWGTTTRPNIHMKPVRLRGGGAETLQFHEHEA